MINAYGKEYDDKIEIAWEKFINDDNWDYSFIRPEIFESWKRSKKAGVDPFHPIEKILSKEELAIRTESNKVLIEIVHPYMEMLYEAVGGAEFFLSLFDKDGFILDILGNEELLAKSQETKLVRGACRSERVAGTNALNVSYQLKKPISCFANEHYLIPHKSFTSHAAPIRDTHGNIIGGLNISGHAHEKHPHTLGMVTAAADGITKELRLLESNKELNDMCSQRNQIIEAVSEGLILLDNNNIVIQINNNALHILKTTASNIMGKDIQHFFYPSGKKRNAQELFPKEVFNEEMNFFISEDADIPVRLNVSANIVSDQDGERIGTLIKLTEQKKINKLVSQISGYRSYYTFSSIIGESQVIAKTIEVAKKAATTDSNVLILGDSGTGKELFAQSIHQASKFSNGPFVPINCGALPKGLIESELFGYERGAFTGASKEGKPGKFELANGGTIFFDEIGDMALDLQVVLLRALELKQITRIGAKYPMDINVRVIAATNRDITEDIKHKTFREDLYYRLNVFTVNIPPLYARDDDVTLLTKYFLQQYNFRKNTNLKISPEVFSAIKKYKWPGNVRELENVLERTFNIASTGLITMDCLPENILRSIETISVDSAGLNSYLPPQFNQTLNGTERQLIIGTLQNYRGNIRKTAAKLGVSRNTLYRKLVSYGVDVRNLRE